MTEIKSKYGKPFTVDWVNPDFMWLVGIVASDGNVNANIDRRSGALSASIRIYNKDLKILKKAQSILNSLGIHTKIRAYNRTPGVQTIEFGNTLLAKLLREFGIAWEKKTYNVFIPDFFYSMEEKLLWGFFSGVFDGDGNIFINEDRYIYRVLISTASKKFAYGLHKLLLHLGIVSKVLTRNINNEVLIGGDKVHFKAINYQVIFTKKKDLIKFKENGYFTKINLPDIQYSSYHNINKHKTDNSSIDFVKVKEIQKSRKSVNVYNIQTKSTNTFFANNFLVHNCGRAGRPQYDTEGESILIAKQPQSVEWLMERYVLQGPEAVYSKLAAMPALRRSILGLIASKTVNDVEELLSFFEKTFYGFQYEAVLLGGKIREVVDMLIVWEMIDPLNVKETLSSTTYGTRVSQLYLDPETAASFAEGLKAGEKKIRKKVHPIAMFDLLVGTPDMISLSFGKGLQAMVEKRFKKLSKYLIKDVPLKEEIEYDFRIRDFNTALFLWDWVNELPIERLLIRYKIGSGDIHRIIDTATWLIAAMSEIASIFAKSNPRFLYLAKTTESLSERVRYGIKSDAISLTTVKGIGRKRARILLDNGIRDINQLSKLTSSDLSKIPGFGTELAKNILNELKGMKELKTETQFDETSISDFFF